MTPDDRLLDAWLDGTLAADDAVRVARAVALDPELAARVDALRARRGADAGDGRQVDGDAEPSVDALRARRGADAGDGRQVDGDADPSVRSRIDGPVASMDTAHPAVAHIEMPPSSAATAASSIPTMDASPAHRRTGRLSRAAALVVVLSLVALATTLLWRGGSVVVVRDDALTARGALAAGLDEALAHAPDAADAVAIGLTFRDADGRLCRSFAQAARPWLAGVACRAGGHWTLPVVAQGGPQLAVDLRAAATALPRELQAAVDARIRGEALDADAERRARAAGWR